MTVSQSTPLIGQSKSQTAGAADTEVLSQSSTSTAILQTTLLSGVSCSNQVSRTNGRYSDGKTVLALQRLEIYSTVCHIKFC